MKAAQKEKKKKDDVVKVVKKGRGKSARSTIIEACTSRTR